MAAYFRNFQTRADLDKSYDVERSVPNFRVYADQWVNNSGQTRRHLTNKLGLRFGPTLEEYCDVFQLPVAVHQFLSLFTAAIGECFLLASSALWLLVRSQQELPQSLQTMRFARVSRSAKSFGRCAHSFPGHTDISPNSTAILKTFTLAVILPVVISLQ